MHGGSLLVIGYVAAVIACVAAPIAGFVFSRHGKAGLGLALAFMTPTGALLALLIPAPY